MITRYSLTKGTHWNKEERLSSKSPLPTRNQRGPVHSITKRINSRHKAPKRQKTGASVFFLVLLVTEGLHVLAGQKSP